jgi:hypothetical protein
MNTRRLVCMLLGAWVAGTFWMFVTATQNFRTVDRLLHDPPPAAEASEMNRFYFDIWEWAQLALGIGTFLLLLFTTSVGRFPLAVSIITVLLVAALHFLLTPHITAYGRSLDFFPPSQLMMERKRFWMMHQAYTIAEGGKLLLLMILAARFVFDRGGRRRRLQEELDIIDNADHSHIDR